MNIGVVSSHVYPYTKGGVEKRVFEVGKRLSARGHTVTVYGFHWWDGPREIEHEGMTLRGVATPGDQFSGERRSILEAVKYSGQLAPVLYRNARHHDIIDIASTAEQFPILIGGFVSKLNKPTLVTTWHEVWPYAYWREYVGAFAPMAWSIQRAAMAVDQVPIAVSELTAERLEPYGFPRHRVEVIPNGVEIATVRATNPIEPGFEVLYVGRLIPEKNVDVLLSAFDIVANGWGDIRLGIIGEGHQRENLEELRDRLDYGDRISFLGTFEDHEDVYRHMRAARLFVLPSTREGFGITVLEAMAAGCIPIVVSHPDSAATEVVDSAGFTPELSASAIASAMEDALNGQSLPIKPERRASEYDWDVIADDIEQFYRELTTR